MEYLKYVLKPSLRVTFLFLFFLAVLVACSTLELEKAFDGQFSPIKNNKTIKNYCWTCHIHKKFNPGEHVLAVRKTYKRSLYREAKECRICHYLEKKWARREVLRKTRYPYGANRGLFREFEQEEMKKVKKIKKSKKSKKSSKPKKSFLGS